jgi:L-iditol 2-dehydrogenase
MSPTMPQLVSESVAPAKTRTMRAAVYRGKECVGLEDVAVPEIGPGEVLLKVAACGICGTDIKKIQHGFVPPPQIFGHEIAGTVVEAGRGVTRWKPGDRAITFHHVPCGGCFYCRRKLFSQCATYKKVGVTAGFQPNGGGFAEYVRIMPWVVAQGMEAIPPHITFEEATFVEPVNTCLKAVQKARVAEGDVAVVIGQGPIGLILTGLTRNAGATVLTSDPLPGRRAMSLRFGAEAALDPAEASGAGPARDDLDKEVRVRTENRGADVVLLAVPNPELVGQALRLARPGGRVLLFAQNDPLMKIEFPAAAVGVEEKEILGSYSAGIDLQQESARLVFERRLPLAELITHRFPLEEVGRALETAARPTEDSLKVVLVP